MEYAVRGPLVIRAGEIEREIKEVNVEIQIGVKLKSWIPNGEKNLSWLRICFECDFF